MSTATIVVLIVAIVVIAILAWMLLRKERTKKLRSRFGPEYDRTIEQYGTAAKAERDLAMRQKRTQKVNIRADVRREGTICPPVAGTTIALRG